MPKRAINLARVSTPQQAKLYSLDFQLEQERAYDAEMGFTVVAEFKDDTSGRKLDRDGLEEACQMLENNEADVLVVWRFDRLHRNYVNSVVMRERIRKAGKEIQYAQTKTVSGIRIRDRIPEELQFLMAELDADTIAENTRRGKERKITIAKKWLGLNQPPYGYKREGQRQDATVVIDEEKASVVRDIYRWYLEGDDGKPLSVRLITERLTAYGIPTPWDHQKSYRHLKRRGHGEWSRSTVYGILNDPSYTGVFYHYRYKRVDGRMMANHNKDQWKGVPIPVIVPQEIWDEAQRKLASGNPMSDRSIRHEYLVSRRVYCECGYKMQATTMTRTKKLKRGGTGTYVYQEYFCPGRKPKTKMAHTCDMPNVNVRIVDERVWQWVRKDIACPEVLKRKLEEIQSEQNNANKGMDESLETLRTHKRTMEEELKRLGMLYAKQAMPTHLLDDLIAQQTQKLELTHKEIVRLEEAHTTSLMDKLITRLVEFSEAFQRKVELIDDSFEAQRTFIDGLNVQVVVFRRNGRLWLRLSSLLCPAGHEVSLQVINTTS